MAVDLYGRGSRVWLRDDAVVWIAATVDDRTEAAIIATDSNGAQVSAAGVAAVPVCLRLCP